MEMAEQESVNFASELAAQASSFQPPQLTISQFKQLELLQHLTSYSELFISVIGDSGAGKSTLATALSASREEPEQTLFIEADIVLGLPAILQRLCQFFDLPDLSHELAQAQQQVKNKLIEMSQQQQSLLVIIDNAEQLDQATIDDISQLATLEQQSLRFILFGNSALESSVLALNNGQPPVHIVHMSLLAEDELTQLVDEYYPQAASWSVPVNKKIIGQSAGNPGLALLLADEHVNAGLVTKASHYPGKFNFPLTHIAALSSVALLIIGGIFYQQHNTQQAEMSAAVISDPAQSISPNGISLLEADHAAVERALAGNKDAEIDYNFAGNEKTIFDSQEGVVTSPAKQPVEDPSVITEAVVSDDAVAETKLAPQAVAAIDVIAEPAVVKTPVVSLYDESVILALPADQFVVQLLGSHSLSSAQGFIKKYQPAISSSLLLYQTQHKGKDWYVVVVGSYASRAVATQKVALYPTALRKQPWIRSVKSVQASL